ncbi:hypothetical protein BC828DRAFT_406349 [Blastocladiella britannica]|nr:hypothetical protein BC828DRAFT_406349 [Blastocladiella britannica]
MLEYALHHRPPNVLVPGWPKDLVIHALQHGRLAVLQWWDHNRDELPVQEIDVLYTFALTRAVERDAAEVLDWWHAHQFPGTTADWQQLRDHPELFAAELDQDQQRPFMDACTSVLDLAAPFTLDFVTSLLPPDVPVPIPDKALLRVMMLEWWLQAHLAASHQMIFPVAEEMTKYSAADKDWHFWMYDTTVTRKIVVYVDSDLGIVSYMAPPLPLSN